ncbi:MAG TPA: hypothetical protein DCX07_05875 [Phycisphaerales bacterium]|nr:hypothetical protein [Phycisphaerales bacterium]
MARIFYWISLLLLLAGARVLIDPDNRQTGETFHVYLTLGVFELYVWLLLFLGKWQGRQGLNHDAGRSGLFAVFVTALSFLGANELHMVSVAEGIAVSAALIALAVLKIMIGPRILRACLPWPFRLACLGWIAAMGLPAIVVSLLAGNEGARCITAYLSFWLAAAVAMLHLLLIRWHVRRKWAPTPGVFVHPLSPWAPLAILAVVTVGTLYGTAWGMYVDYAPWYGAAPVLSILVVTLALAAACGRRWLEACFALGIAVAMFGLQEWGPAPSQLPAAWRTGAMEYVMDPIYLIGGCLTVFFLLAAWAVRTLWLLCAAAVPPITGGVVYTIRKTWNWKHSTGVWLLVGALLALGLGVLIQWALVRAARQKQVLCEEASSDALS